jgi:hypothetical protein
LRGISKSAAVKKEFDELRDARFTGSSRNCKFWLGSGF